MPAEAGRWLRAGRVGRPHGLDGSFHVLEPNAPLLALGMHVVIEGEEVKITRRAGDDRRPIVRLEGREDRRAATALRDRELLVERSEAPELEQDEWWAEDLEGCEVYDGEQRIGVVRRLVAFPSVDVLEVERGAGEAELLVPLVDDAVRAVDIERKRIEVQLGFLADR